MIRLLLAFVLCSIVVGSPADAQLALLGVGGGAVVAPPALCGTVPASKPPPNTGANFAISFASAVASGCSILGFVTMDQGHTLTSCTDDKSNVYTIADSNNNVGQTQRSYDFYSLNLTNGPITVTCTFSASGPGNGITVEAVSGISGVDGHALQSNAASTTPASASITPTHDGDWIWSAIMGYSCPATNTASAGTGYVKDTPNTACMAIEHKIQATHGAVTAGWVTSASSPSDVGIMAFHP